MRQSQSLPKQTNKQTNPTTPKHDSKNITSSQYLNKQKWKASTES